MLGCTNARLDQLMDSRTATRSPTAFFITRRFALPASWILLLTSLSRNSVLTLSTDLTKLADEMKLARPTIS